MTKDIATDQPIKLALSTKEIQKQGLKKQVTLDETQRQTLETSLEIRSFSHFIADLQIIPLPKERFQLQGNLIATFKQISALSLEPVEMQMNENFITQFWPIEQNNRSISPELDLDYADEMIEFYEGDTLDIGQVVYEYFVISLEQFPRAKGEKFDWETPDEASSSSQNPFEVLKVLKGD